MTTCCEISGYGCGVLDRGGRAANPFRAGTAEEVSEDRGVRRLRRRAPNHHRHHRDRPSNVSHDLSSILALPGWGATGVPSLAVRPDRVRRGFPLIFDGWWTDDGRRGYPIG
jgi:hypothetical protein